MAANLPDGFMPVTGTNASGTVVGERDQSILIPVCIVPKCLGMLKFDARRLWDHGQFACRGVHIEADFVCDLRCDA